jgi:hypothetical protein
MLDMHHIISDAASMNIIIREISELLTGNTLPEPKLQYKDFSVWQNKLLKSELMIKQETYWLNRLSGEIPVLNMPLDFKRPAYRSQEGNTLYFSIDKELVKSIKSLAILSETTIYVIMLSAYSILLSKYTKQEDIIIGVTIEGRNHPDLRDVVGLFATTPVVRHCLKGDKEIRSFLTEVKEELLNVYENQDYPFEYLVNKLQLRRPGNENPLFSTLFSMYSVDISGLTTDKNMFELFKYNHRSSMFDIAMESFETGDILTYNLRYRTDLFKADTIRCLARNYEEILREIVKNPFKKIEDIILVNEIHSPQKKSGYSDEATV